jgi:hypothetical protein
VQELTLLSLFLGSLKSERTKKAYKYHLDIFLKEAGLDMGKLLALDTKSIEALIIQYLISLKDTAAYQSRQLKLAAISAFLLANDVEINKRKLKKFLGENVKTVDDRANPGRDCQDSNKV